MKKYKTPEVEITKFKSEDILVKSGALADINAGYLDGDEAEWN